MAETSPDGPKTAALADDGHSSSNRRRRIRRRLLLLGPVLFLAVGGYVYLTGGRMVSTDNAYIKADKVLIAAEVSGLIDHVAVKENQHVATGDVLFSIDSRTYRIASEEALANLAGVRDELTALKASYRQKAKQLALAQADVAFAKKEFDRQSNLIESRAVSRSKFDATGHDLDVARRQVEIVQQEMAQIQAQLSDNPDIPLADHPRYRAMQAELNRAKLNLDRTVVKAPFAGIASNTPQIGQQVIGSGATTSPVMSLVSDTSVWIVANFKETDLTHVKPGQPATIQIDSYPDKLWRGTVESVSPATGAEFSVIPPQNATGNWVKVVQRIPVRIAVNRNAGDPAFRAGTSTVVEIDTGQYRRLPGFLKTALSWFGPPTADVALGDGR